MIIYACLAFDPDMNEFSPGHLSVCGGRAAAWHIRGSMWCFLAVDTSDAPVYYVSEVVGISADEGDAVRWVAEGVLTRDGEEVMP